MRRQRRFFSAHKPATRAALGHERGLHTGHLALVNFGGDVVVEVRDDAFKVVEQDLKSHEAK